jgi:hypothetical protein
MGLFGLFGKRTPAKESFRERRVLPRWGVNISAHVQPQGSAQSFACELVNLNLRGFELSCATALPSDCTRIVLRLGEEYIFNLGVQIVWSTAPAKRFVYGVKITQIRDADKEKIFQYVSRNFPDQVERQVRK